MTEITEEELLAAKVVKGSHWDDDFNYGNTWQAVPLVSLAVNGATLRTHWMPLPLPPEDKK